MKNITYKDEPDQFLQLCHELNIPYHTTVHHFEPDAQGIYRPVMWDVIAREARDRRLKK